MGELQKPYCRPRALRVAEWLDRRRWHRSARLVARLAPAPSNRAELLIRARPGDECDAFVQVQPGEDYRRGDCRTDGHYLCDDCSCLDRWEAIRRGLVEPNEDERDDIQDGIEDGPMDGSQGWLTITVDGGPGHA